MNAQPLSCTTSWLRRASRRTIASLRWPARCQPLPPRRRPPQAAVIAEMNTQITVLEQQLAADFESHPDAVVARSLPGLGTILGARVLGEFGDAPGRYATAKSRKNYGGTSPITRASGTKRAVLARHARNKRLADAIYPWAFSALTASPGAQAFYDHRRAVGDTHHQALRALGNRLVGILHGCLASQTLYSEDTAWAHRTSHEITRAA
jgi:transposase